MGRKLGFFVFLHELAYLATLEIVSQISKIFPRFFLEFFFSKFQIFNIYMSV